MKSLDKKKKIKMSDLSDFDDDDSMIDESYDPTVDAKNYSLNDRSDDSRDDVPSGSKESAFIESQSSR